MADAWILDASPIISLSRAGHFDVLRLLGGELLLPDAVAAEIHAGPENDRARSNLDLDWLHRASPGAVPPSVLEWSLGAGESSVIALAMERPGSTAVLDDAEARRCARTLGVSVIGTLGVVVRLQRRGCIRSAGEIVRDLRRHGLHLDDELIRSVLSRSVGEDWIP